MNERNPYNLVKLAFKNQELDKLLLGKDPYKYMNRFFSGSGDTDILTLTSSGIFPYVEKDKAIEDYLRHTLYALCTQYDGLPALASFMLSCSIHKKNKGVMPVDIDFKKLAKEMENNISKYEIRLKNDFTGDGWDNEEGKYGDLKRLSKQITEIGGPDFFPEENNQENGIKM